MDFHASQLLFQSMDSDKDGFITVMDFAAGLFLTFNDACDRMQQAGYSPSSAIDLTAFLKIMAYSQIGVSHGGSLPGPASWGTPASAWPIVAAPTLNVTPPTVTGMTGGSARGAPAGPPLPDDVAAEFRQMDADGDGHVSALEYAAALTNMGYDMTLQQALALFNEAGCPTNGLMGPAVFGVLQRLLRERYPNGPHATRLATRRPAAPLEARFATQPLESEEDGDGCHTPFTESPTSRPTASPHVPFPITQAPPTEARGSPVPARRRPTATFADSVSTLSSLPETRYEPIPSIPPPHRPDASTLSSLPNTRYEPIPSIPPPHRSDSSSDSAAQDFRPLRTPQPHQSGAEWVDTRRGFLYKHVEVKPPDVFYMEGGVRAVMDRFPADQTMVCTYSGTLGNFVLVRRHAAEEF